jgi:hypothetical protein
VDPSIAAFTISQEHEGAMDISFETISRTCDCSEATAFFTVNASVTQSTFARTEMMPMAAAKMTKLVCFFIIRIFLGA